MASGYRDGYRYAEEAVRRPQQGEPPRRLGARAVIGGVADVSTLADVVGFIQAVRESTCWGGRCTTTAPRQARIGRPCSREERPSHAHRRGQPPANRRSVADGIPDNARHVGPAVGPRQVGATVEQRFEGARLGGIP